MPVRLQLQRKAGWRLPTGTVRVDRATPWGNPYRVWRDESGDWWASNGGCHYGPFGSKAAAAGEAVDRFRADIERPGPHHSRLVDAAPTIADVMKALRGRDLACWCKPGEPCHADVLIDIANRPLCEAVQ